MLAFGGDPLHWLPVSSFAVDPDDLSELQELTELQEDDVLIHRSVALCNGMVHQRTRHLIRRSRAQ